MIGAAGRDKMYVEEGDDTVSGGADCDYLFGGAGDDLMTGGAGADRFIFEDTRDNDVITDFEVGVDIIVMDTLGLSATDLTVTDVTYAGQAALEIAYEEATLTFEGLTSTDYASITFQF